MQHVMLKSSWKILNHCVIRNSHGNIRSVSMATGGASRFPLCWNSLKPRSMVVAVVHRSSATTRTSAVVAADVSINRNNNNNNNGSSSSTDLVETNNIMKKPTKAGSSTLSALGELFKYRLSALVVGTTSVGFIAQNAIDSAASIGSNSAAATTFVACCAGTALCSMSASTVNQIVERHRDARMKRTKHRPLPTGTITPMQASALAAVTGISGSTLLYTMTDPITCLLGTTNMALYAGLYTYLKPRSTLNTWVGAIVGAIPPLMGWVSAGGTLMDLEAWFLASTLYLWQMPHFFALSWMYRTDYQRGGFQMISRHDPLGSTTSSLILRYTTYLSTIPLLSTACGITSSMFALESIVFNSVALRVAYQFTQDRTTTNARKVFLTSLWYLPCWMMLFLLHAKKNTNKNNSLEEGEDEDKLELSIIQQGLEFIRQKGKEHCIHEQVVYGGGTNSYAITTNILPRTTAIAEERKIKGEESCPLILGKDAVIQVSTKAMETATTVVAVAEAVSSNSNTSGSTSSNSSSSASKAATTTS
jgi:protoheme IX farnesyltransferase